MNTKNWSKPVPISGQPAQFLMRDGQTIDGLYSLENPGGSWMRYPQVKARLKVDHAKFMSCLVHYRTARKIDDNRPFFAISPDGRVWVRNFLPYSVEMILTGKPADECYFSFFQVSYCDQCQQP